MFRTLCPYPFDVTDVVKCRSAWAARFRRLARDYERLATTLAGLHVLAFAYLMLHQFAHSVSRR